MKWLGNDKTDEQHFLYIVYDDREAPQYMFYYGNLTVFKDNLKKKFIANLNRFVRPP